MAKKKKTKKKQEPTSLFGELSSLLICIGGGWMLFIPDTIQKSDDGSITIAPDFIPVIILGAGLVLMIMLSLYTWSENR